MKCGNCSGDRSELRRRRIAGGSVQFAEQCLTCGRAVSNPLKQSNLPCPPDRIPLWDTGAEERYSATRLSAIEAEKAQHRAEFFAEHDSYLATPKWRGKRAAVMARAGGLCEGCRTHPATQVHHLTYEHWQDEFLWELVAICDGCHERVHAAKDREA